LLKPIRIISERYPFPEVIDLCRSKDVDFILGAATTKRLRKHVGTIEAGTAARFKGAL